MNAIHPQFQCAHDGLLIVGNKQDWHLPTSSLRSYCVIHHMYACVNAPRRYAEDGMVANLIATYDEDGNGRLSLPEFTEMCRSVRRESVVRNHARLGFT